jgi:hypothetical protein
LRIKVEGKNKWIILIKNAGKTTNYKTISESIKSLMWKKYFQKLTKYSNPFRKALALFIVAVYVIVLISVYPIITNWNEQSNSMLQERTYDHSFGLKLNQNSLLSSEQDLSFDIKISHSYNIALVDEPVAITATVVLRTPQAKSNISAITLSFENAQAYPRTTDYYGQVNGANLIILNYNHEAIMNSTTMCWPSEGNFHLVCAIFFTDGTNQQLVQNNIVMPVYSRTELEQIQTNQVSIILSIAVFVFSLVGVFDLFMRLWSNQK